MQRTAFTFKLLFQYAANNTSIHFSSHLSFLQQSQNVCWHHAKFILNCRGCDSDHVQILFASVLNSGQQKPYRRAPVFDSTRIVAGSFAFIQMVIRSLESVVKETSEAGVFKSSPRGLFRPFECFRSSPAVTQPIQMNGSLSAGHQGVSKSANDPFVWNGCAEAGKRARHAGLEDWIWTPLM